MSIRSANAHGLSAACQTLFEAQRPPGEQSEGPAVISHVLVGEDRRIVTDTWQEVIKCCEG